MNASKFEVNELSTLMWCWSSGEENWKIVVEHLWVLYFIKLKQFYLLLIHSLRRQRCGHACVGCSKWVYITWAVPLNFSGILRKEDKKHSKSQKQKIYGSIQCLLQIKSQGWQNAQDLHKTNSAKSAALVRKGAWTVISCWWIINNPRRQWRERQFSSQTWPPNDYSCSRRQSCTLHTNWTPWI